MAELTPAQIRIRDPLSEVTRKERRFLLGISIIAIALVRTGLVPSRISALGIEFSQTDQKSLLSILALVTLYFLVAFSLYAISDFVAWRLAFVEALKEWSAQQAEFVTSRQEEIRADIYRKHAVRFRYVSLLAGPVSFFRAIFEFLLPLLVGVYATVLLLKTPPPLQQEHHNTSAIILSHDVVS